MTGYLNAIIFGINTLIEDHRIPERSRETLRKINNEFVESDKKNDDLTILFEALYKFTSHPDWTHECKAALWEVITKIEKEFV